MRRIEVRGKNPIFLNKEGGRRYAGVLTQKGTAAFEDARRRLAVLAGRKTASDGDVMEFLARGEDETRAYLEGR